MSIIEKKYKEIYNKQLIVNNYFVGVKSIYNVVEILEVNSKYNFANIIVKDNIYCKPYKQQVFVSNNFVVLPEEVSGFSCEKVTCYLKIIEKE